MTKETVSKPQHSSLLRLFRNRFIAGLFVILPIYITYALLKWLYDLLYSNALQPITYGLRKLWGLPTTSVEGAGCSTRSRTPNKTSTNSNESSWYRSHIRA